MAEYIDRAGTAEFFEKSKQTMWHKDDIAATISSKKNTPSADVVEVVRCKDCKHLTVHNSPTLYAYCEKTHYRFEPFKTDTRTHFCSYGEKRDESSL